MAVAMGHILPPRYIGASMVVEGLRYRAWGPSPEQNDHSLSYPSAVEFNTSRFTLDACSAER